jgi:hypothetical protein
MSERPVWRPTRPATSEPAEPDRPLMCGGEGPILSVDERFEMMRELKREWDAEKAREADEEEKARKAEKQKDDEDEQRVIERFRNDRYAVKLLQQADNVWGGGAGDTGALG